MVYFSLTRASMSRGVRVGLAAAVLREAVPVHASLIGATPTPASDAVTVTANPIGVRIINVRLFPL